MANPIPGLLADVKLFFTTRTEGKRSVTLAEHPVLAVGLTSAGDVVALQVGSDGTLVVGGGSAVPTTPGAAATNTGANHAATKRQTSTNAAVSIIAARTTRRAALFKNTDAANTVEISQDAAVTFGNGYPLAPGEAAVVTSTVAWYVIDNGSHASVAVVDEYD